MTIATTLVWAVIVRCMGSPVSTGIIPNQKPGLPM